MGVVRLRFFDAAANYDEPRYLPAHLYRRSRDEGAARAGIVQKLLDEAVPGGRRTGGSIPRTHRCGGCYPPLPPMSCNTNSNGRGPTRKSVLKGRSSMPIVKRTRAMPVVKAATVSRCSWRLSMPIKEEKTTK